MPARAEKKRAGSGKKRLSKPRNIQPEIEDLALSEIEGSKKRQITHRIRPMLATLVEEPFDRPGWLFEVKWDGYRAVSEVREGDVNLYSRNNKPLEDKFIEIVRSLERLPFTAILDGEIVAVDESGRAGFQLLQNYMRTGSGLLVYYVFDLLYLDGYDLRGVPLIRRKDILKKILPQTGNIKFSDHIEDKGTSFFRLLSDKGVEGMLAKKASGIYREGVRGRDWLKVKTYLRQEAVICGFTRPRGGRKGFGSLVLGAYEDGKLVYIGHSGGGFTDEELKTFTEQKLRPHIQNESPFSEMPPVNAPVTWVRPELVCEIRFAEWTKDGYMRQPVFLGLREDKDPEDVRRERSFILHDKAGKPLFSPDAEQSTIIIGDRDLRLTNLDKIFWPEKGYTKRDLIEYYRETADIILPYLKGRPESLNRHPDGIDGKSFFQKNITDIVPEWVPRVTIHSGTEKRDITYLICEDEATLVFIGNLGCIEINPWNSRMKSLDRPDYLVIDLDPLDTSFDYVIEAARATREVLDGAGAGSFCKTSGATGLHIYVPLGAKYTYAQAQQFARLIALLVHSRLPETTSVERLPGRRHHRIYLDYLQNRRGQTVAAPYSLRPRPGAPVSIPLKWQEVVPGLDPMKFNMKTIMRRVEKLGDLWKGVLGPGIDLVSCLDRLKEKAEEQ